MGVNGVGNGARHAQLVGTGAIGSIGSRQDTIRGKHLAHLLPQAVVSVFAVGSVDFIRFKTAEGIAWIVIRIVRTVRIVLGLLHARVVEKTGSAAFNGQAGRVAPGAPAASVQGRAGPASQFKR